MTASLALLKVCPDKRPCCAEDLTTAAADKLCRIMNADLTRKGACRRGRIRDRNLMAMSKPLLPPKSVLSPSDISMYALK